MANVNLNISIDERIKDVGENYLLKTGLTWGQLLEEVISLRELNQDSLEAIEEIETMIHLGDYGKTYNDVDLMMKEILQ